MEDWKTATNRGIIAGTSASVLSTLALAVLGKGEAGSMFAPTNAISHWLWGDKAVRRDAPSLRYTLTGYLIHHASATFWAVLFERIMGARLDRKRLASTLPASVAASAVACFVDYQLTPARLTMEPFVLALIAHGVLGGVDVALNHELIAKVPSLRHGALEQALHGVRELIFAMLFFSTAWFAWHGLLAWCLAALVLAELIVSVLDVVAEKHTRDLPLAERVLHLLLFVNLGVIATLLGQALLDWARLPAALVPVDYGWASRTLTVLAALALAWSIRDGLAAIRLGTGRNTAFQ